MSLPPWQLQSLIDDTFRSRLDLFGTVDAIYAALRRAPEVRTLHWAMRERSIGHDQLDEFIRSLLQSYATGTYFEHQYALAGIAVACDQVPEYFAKEFIEYLARLDSVELQIAVAVARLVENDSRIAITTLTATFFEQDVTELHMVAAPKTSETPQLIEDFRLEVA